MSDLSLDAHALDDAMAGGWRPVETAPDQATSCAVTVHDVVSEGRRPLLGDWRIEVLVDDAVVGTAAVGDHDGLDHRRAVGWTVPDAIASEGTCLPGSFVGVRLIGPDGEVLSGRTLLPRELPSGHRHGSMLLRAHEDGEVEATVWLDLRLLGADLADAHPDRAPDEWDEAARAAFAERATPVLAAGFAELFPPALVEVRRSSPGGTTRRAG